MALEVWYAVPPKNPQLPAEKGLSPVQEFPEESVKPPPPARIRWIKEAVGAFTVRLKAVVLERPPPAAVTVMVAAPVAAALEALRVKVDEQVGEQLAAEKDAVTPAGRPEALRLTAWDAPDTSVAVIAFVAD